MVSFIGVHLSRILFSFVKFKQFEKAFFCADEPNEFYVILENKHFW